MRRERMAEIRFRVTLGIVILLVLFSVLAPLFMPHDPNATNALFKNSPPSPSFLLGTDRYGRCVLSRIMAGAATSVFSSVLLVIASMIVGMVSGMVAGWAGGITDRILMRICDLFLSFPQMVLAIAVSGLLGGSLINACIAMGVTGWTVYARVARAHTIALKNEPFIAAAKENGGSGLHILLVHIMPNVAGPLIVTAATQLGSTLTGIAGLSFLGLGAVPPQAEWGSMINESRAYITLSPWAVLSPAIAVFVTVVIFNYFGDAVRDCLSDERT